MTVAVLAGLSLSEEMKTLGAWAGFAAVLGLAVLTALFVAQARELKRLREWAGAAPERAIEERRAQAQAQQAQAEAQRRAAYQPKVQAPPPVAGQAPVAAAPAAQDPAAVSAAPATAVAVARKAATVAREAAKAVVQQGPGTAAAEEKPPQEGAAGTPPAGAAQPAPPGTEDPKGAPAPDAPGPKAAGGAAATANGTVKGDAATAVASASGAGATKPAAAGAQPPSKAAPQPVPPPLLTTSGAKGQRNPLMLLGGVVAAGLVVVFLSTRLFGGDDGTPTGAPVEPQPGSRAPSGPAGGAIQPTARKRIVVAVLNGTTTTGLARGAADRLQSRGYRIGQVTNATDQSRTASSVSYAAGYRRAAMDVARIVHASIGTVRPMDAATRVVAGEDAMVVVTVGSDQST
jgi:hypothetical protein